MERDPVAVVRLAGGRAGAAEIVDYSGRRRLAAAVRSGRLVRARRGLYTLPALPDPLALAAELGGVVSHASAADLLGARPVHAPELVDVTVRRGARPRSHPKVQLHWTRRLGDDEVDQGMTTPLRTFLDCAGTLPFPEALAIADGLLSLSYVREQQQLLEAARATRGAGRPARITVALAADRRAANPFESVLRALVIETGVGGFVPQLEIRLARRLVYADLADADRRLVLEADSFAYHGTRSGLVRDCDRYNDLVAAGWTVLRFPWEHVMFHPERVRRVLMETCARIDAARRRTQSRTMCRPGAA